MRSFRFTFLLGIVFVLALAPACNHHSGRSNYNNSQIASLAAIMIFNSPLAQYALNSTGSFPRVIETINVKHNGTEGDVNVDLNDSSGTVQASPSSFTLQPGQQMQVAISALALTYVAAILTMSCVYGSLNSTDRLDVPFTFNLVPSALAVLGIISWINSNSATLPDLFWPAIFLGLIGVIVLHSAGGIRNKIPLLLFTEIAFVGLLTFALQLSTLNNCFWRSKNSPTVAAVAFPPGDGPRGYTVHPDIEVDQKAGDYHFFHMTMLESIPLADANTKNKHVYSFVMDSDLLAANNWVANPSFPNDFFKGTDRWYQLKYDNKAGWTLSVMQVSPGNKTAVVPSAARAIIKDNGIVLLVPAAEFKSAKPSWRATSFVHEGDFGINSPYTWSGDVTPPVTESLIQTK